MIKLTSISTLSLGLISLLGVSSSNAYSLVVNPTNAGWYSSSSTNNTNVGPIANTLAGGSTPDSVYRSFYVFAIPSLNPNDYIVSATLQWTFGNLNSPQGYETYALRSYEGSVAGLVGGNGSFSDLGDGKDYGQKTFYSSGGNSMGLSTAAVTDMNASIGQQIAFGGVITTLQLDGGIYTGEYYVTNSGTDPSVIQLALNVTTVPIPPALWLLGSGLLGLIGVARRKAAQ